MSSEYECQGSTRKDVLAVKGIITLCHVFIPTFSQVIVLNITLITNLFPKDHMPKHYRTSAKRDANNNKKVAELLNLSFYFQT